MDDFLVQLDVWLENAILSSEKEAYLAGIGTGLNVAERMIEFGRRELPMPTILFLKRSLDEVKDVDSLNSSLSQLLPNRIPIKFFVTPELLKTIYHRSYMEGVLKGLESLYSVYSYTHSVLGWIQAGRLTKNFLDRVRKYISELPIGIKNDSK